MFVHIYILLIHHNQEEKISGGGAESFGKQWQPGDIVGVFLDLVDHTISKTVYFLQDLHSTRRTNNTDNTCYVDAELKTF